MLKIKVMVTSGEERNGTREASRVLGHIPSLKGVVVMWVCSP